MSETQELKLACLHQAGGDLDKAKELFEWVIGSAPEASEQRATDQPEQPFNYRHPSKHDGSMPRRCYLDQLTPEELMIRDVAATVEGLGAHPLLTATVIKLMQAGEALADWVDIGLRDKAIQALLDPVPSPSPESSSQETVTEAAEKMQLKLGARASNKDKAQNYSRQIGIPDGFIKWDGADESGPADVPDDALVEIISHRGQRTARTMDLFWGLRNSDDDLDIIAYRVVATSQVLSELDSQVQADGDRVEPEDLPKLSDSDFQALPKFEGEEREIPEGFTRWEGAHPASAGIEYDTQVEVIQRDGKREVSTGGKIHRWWWEPGMPEYDIIAYRIIEAPSVVSEVESHKARNRGYLEYHEGKYATENPYGNWEGQEAPLPAAEWLRGWKDADKEANDRIDAAIAAVNVETPPASCELDSQVTPQDAIEQSHENPAAAMFGKALAAESEAKEQRKYNPFAIFGAKVDA